MSLIYSYAVTLDGIDPHDALFLSAFWTVVAIFAKGFLWLTWYSIYDHLDR